jgi:hypothetical protein
MAFGLLASNSLVLRPGAAHSSLPRQFGAGERVVVMDHAIL